MRLDRRAIAEDGLSELRAIVPPRLHSRAPWRTEIGRRTSQGLYDRHAGCVDGSARLPLLGPPACGVGDVSHVGLNPALLMALPSKHVGAASTELLTRGGSAVVRQLGGSQWREGSFRAPRRRGPPRPTLSLIAVHAGCNSTGRRGSADLAASPHRGHRRETWLVPLRDSGRIKSAHSSCVGSSGGRRVFSRTRPSAQEARSIGVWWVLVPSHWLGRSYLDDCGSRCSRLRPVGGRRGCSLDERCVVPCSSLVDASASGSVRSSAFNRASGRDLTRSPRSARTDSGMPSRETDEISSVHRIDKAKARHDEELAKRWAAAPELSTAGR